MESPEVSPATTEISLSGGDYGNGDTNGDHYQNNKNLNGTGEHRAEQKQLAAKMPKGGDIGLGSASIGSRLAGDDSSVGSRLAGAAPKQSPVYNPSVARASSMKSSMGFGNTVTPTPATQKLTNLTFQDVQRVASEKGETFKSWSVKTYRCTKQMLSEKMGRSTKTVDLELEARIEVLRDTKLKYENVVALSKAFANHFGCMIQTQKVLGEALGELSAKSQDLQEEFQYNAETQHVLAKNGEAMLAAVNFFISGLNTLCSRTMDDTLITVKRYETARVEFDAYRSDLEQLKLAPRSESNVNKQAQAQLAFNKHKEIYERLRADVGVKLQFLDENRVKVMQKQLLVFHNAITAYFAGNQQQLASTLKQFNIKPDPKTSWLESNQS